MKRNHFVERKAQEITCSYITLQQLLEDKEVHENPVVQSMLDRIRREASQLLIGNEESELLFDEEDLNNKNFTETHGILEGIIDRYVDWQEGNRCRSKKTRQDIGEILKELESSDPDTANKVIEALLEENEYGGPICDDMFLCPLELSKYSETFQKKYAKLFGQKSATPKERPRMKWESGEIIDFFQGSMDTLIQMQLIDDMEHNRSLCRAVIKYRQHKGSISTLSAEAKQHFDNAMDAFKRLNTMLPGSVGLLLLNPKYQDMRKNWEYLYTVAKNGFWKVIEEGAYADIAMRNLWLLEDTWVTLQNIMKLDWAQDPLTYVTSDEQQDEKRAPDKKPATKRKRAPAKKPVKRGGTKKKTPAKRAARKKKGE